MSWLEKKYISLLSSRLRNFKQKSSGLFNFSCPYCLDSQKNKNKARGYLYEKKGSFSYHCHNCGHSTGFVRFLKENDPDLHKEFLLETMRESGQAPEPEPDVRSKIFDDSVFAQLPRISELGPNHFARQFVLSRKIPTRFYDTLFFAKHYKTFVNNLIPNKLGGPDGPRLVIPFVSYDKKLIGFQARALDNDSLRYSMIILNNNLPKVYGADRVDTNRRYYVIEGPIDSMFLDNAIAVGGSDLLSGLVRLGSNRDNAVIVFDNEPRNQEILAKMDKAINTGHSIVIWPTDLVQKDINDMVLSGLTPSEVQAIIDQHTYKGLAAKMAFVAWKRRSDDVRLPKSSTNSDYQAGSSRIS